MNTLYGMQIIKASILVISDWQYGAVIPLREEHLHPNRGSGEVIDRLLGKRVRCRLVSGLFCECGNSLIFQIHPDDITPIGEMPQGSSLILCEHRISTD